MLNSIKKTTIAMILMIALVVTPNSFAEAKDDVNYEDVIKKADIMARQLTTLYGVTSVQYALIDEGKVVISGNSGVYSKDNKTALTNTHMYGIGSVSKMYTTVAVMQLVEAGKVKLDAPVTKYIKDFKMADTRYKKITVRMLLNHSSGLLGSTFNNTFLFNDNDQSGYDNLLTALSTQRLKADPGAFSVYCNDGFSLAQLLVERVTGISFTEYIKKNISEPLSLENTKTPMDEFPEEKLVKTYLTGNKALPKECLSVIGTGGIYSTAEDLCHFAKLFMKNSNSSVLSEASAKAMMNPEYKNGLWASEHEPSSFGYGLGWDNINVYPFSQYGIKALVKGGDTLLYHSSLVVLPEEGMAMAVVTSGGSSAYNQLFAQEILLKGLLAKGTIQDIIPNKTVTTPVKVDMPADYKTNCGYYSAGGALVKIDISDIGVVSLSISSGNAPSSVQKFYHTGEGKFYSSDGSTYISFVKEHNGNTYLYAAAYSNLPFLGQMVTSEYQAQKIEANPISDKVKTAWKKRENKNYFMINERYSSQYYALGGMMVQGTMDKNIEGYMANASIIDENTALTYLQIPGMNGRDLNDYHFYTEGKTEYLKVGNYILISEDAIKNLSDKANLQIKLDTKGYAKWYKIGDNIKNKKIKVTLPKNASFSVYKADGTLVYNSWISDPTAVTLPAKGYIVFAGDAGAKFTVKYVK